MSGLDGRSVLASGYTRVLHAKGMTQSGGSSSPAPGSIPAVSGSVPSSVSRSAHVLEDDVLYVVSQR